MDNNNSITIKNSTVVTTLKRSDLVSVSETHDGMTFSFKGGLHLYITDMEMPLYIKSKIKMTIDNFKNVDVLVDLNNKQNPVQAFAQ